MHPQASAVTLALATILALAPAAHAQVSIAPGQTVVLSGSDYNFHYDGAASSLSCSIGPLTGCDEPGFLDSEANLNTNHVSAKYVALVNAGTGLGQPRVATASLSDEFKIAGPTDDLVPVQISTTFDVSMRLGGVGASVSSGELSLSVEDITSDLADGVGTVTLFSEEHSGDQGFTDVAAGQSISTASGANGSLALLLRRGHTYRVTFSLEGTAEQLVLGEALVITSATRHALVVHADEDEIGELRDHDAAVQGRLDRIESKLDTLGDKVDLLLRTQLEQALVQGKGKKSTVLHTERKTEVCDTAQRAIDASADDGYHVKAKAQALVDRAHALMESDPEQAVTLCTKAYRLAAAPTGRESETKD